MRNSDRSFIDGLIFVPYNSMRTVYFILLILLPLSLNAQLKGSALKLEGTWTYKESPGFEVWERNGDQMIGKAYRVNKMGDTSLVEEMSIRSVNDRLLYNSTTFNRTGDSLIRVVNMFIGKRRKMKFTNIAREIPFAIHYGFGFLNRKKLKIQIYFNEGEKAKKIILNKAG